jgi:hypothetical protein
MRNRAFERKVDYYRETLGFFCLAFVRLGERLRATWKGWTTATAAVTSRRRGDRYHGLLGFINH